MHSSYKLGMVLRPGGIILEQRSRCESHGMDTEHHQCSPLSIQHHKVYQSIPTLLLRVLLRTCDFIYRLLCRRSPPNILRSMHEFIQLPDLLRRHLFLQLSDLHILTLQTIPEETTREEGGGALKKTHLLN